MTEHLLWRSLGEQVQYFDAWVNSLRQREITDPSFIDAMNEITPAAHRLAASLVSAQEATRKAALEGRIKAIQEIGEAAEAVLLASARLCETILSHCREAADAGLPVASHPGFEQTANQIRRMPGEWRKRWPFIDPVMLEKTANAYAEGRYQLARDAFHELRSRSTSRS